MGITLLSSPLPYTFAVKIHHVLKHTKKNFFLNHTQDFELTTEVLFYRKTLHRLGGEFQRK